MSILIKDMKIPQRGMVVNIYADGRVTNHFDEFGKTIGKAVSVPPHGRLIDADALVEDLKRQCEEVFKIDAVSPEDFWITRDEAYNERLWKTWCESFFDYLNTREIVIQKEEGE